MNKITSNNITSTNMGAEIKSDVLPSLGGARQYCPQGYESKVHGFADVATDVAADVATDVATDVAPNVAADVTAMLV